MIKFRLFLLWAAWTTCLALSPNLSHSQNCANTNGLFLVTNTNDDGPGSLREAIECANTIFGSNTIHFDIPGLIPPYIIEVGSTSGLPLPALLDPATIIDARTQLGYVDEPVIILDGGNNNWSVPINAIWVRSNFCEVYGFEIRNFPDDGIDLRTADFSTIRDNYIHDNGDETDYWSGVPGTGPWEGCGIVIREGSNNNVIAGNAIENNEYCGILIRSNSDANLIGGPDATDANIISENAAGIRINNNNQSILIQQNALFCNDTLGIELVGNANNNQTAPVITSAIPGLISGTADDGVVVEVFIAKTIDCPEAVCQGSLWLGTTVANNGVWTLSPPFENNTPLFGGNVVTATARDAFGNTSEFAACTVVIGTSGCTTNSGDILVTNTHDNGTGSLRAAIECANTTPGANMIIFEIPGDSIHTIFVGSETDEPLPALLDIGTTIDATTQQGYGANGDYSPRIVLDGSDYDWTAPINAVWVRGNYCEVYGLEIINFPDDGIDVTNADYVKIGDVGKGNVVYNNGDETDYWPDAPGTGPWNGCGIVLKQGSDHCKIIGNTVGTDFNQNNTLGNELCGIIIQNGGDNNILAENTIAHHLIGIRIDNGGFQNTMSQNSLYCNDSIPVLLNGNANANKEAPQLDSVSNLYISGFADSLDIVEIFVNVDSSCMDTFCQGTVYLGTAIVIDSIWVLEAPFYNGIQLLTGDKITATATDVNGNTSDYSDCIEISIECNLEASIANVQHTTCGFENGSFTVELVNGTPPFLLDIGNGPTSGLQFDNLAAGDYSLTVIDHNDCTATAQISIAASSSPEVSISNLEDAHCNEDDGMFTVDAIAGTAPYTFDIGNGPQSNNEFTNLGAGTYQVTVTDDVGCSTSIDVVLVQTGNPIPGIIDFMDASCNENNGLFSVGVLNGVPPYQYDIGNGPQSNNEFIDLAAGLYTVTVTDDFLCTASISVSIGQSGIPDVMINDLEMATCNEANGAFTVEVNGGIPPYLYDIGNGPGSNNVFENLAEGVYNVSVTDDANCMISIQAIIDQSGIPTGLITENTPATCDQANGSFLVEAAGGVTPYMYDIGNGPGNTNLFDNLAEGSYTVTITDAVNCSGTISTLIVQTGSPVLEVAELSNDTCQQSIGSLLLSTVGGTSPYTWDIGNGPEPTSQFNDLSAGVYTITVSDNFGCTSGLEVIIENEGISPTAIFFYNDEDGMVTFVSDSEEAESYFWDFGDDQFSIIENPVHTYEESGDYQVCLTVGNDCGSDTYCELVSVTLPLTLVDIGGEIEKENGQAVGLVEVNCTNNPTQTTTANGEFLFEEQEAGMDYLIEPTKDINYINGCSTFDLFLINQHILDITPLDSPYKIIAADIDNSGSVTAVDLIRLQQVILFVVDTFPNNTSWRFVPEDYVFLDPQHPLEEDFPETIELLNIDSDELNNDFVAIKVGDVNLSSNPAAFTDPEGPGIFKLRNLSQKKDEVLIEYKLNGAQSLSAFETSLHIDLAHLEFLDIDPQSLIHPEFYFDRQKEILHLSWFDPSGHGLMNEEIEFTIRFRSKSNDWMKGISATNIGHSKLYSIAGEASNIGFEFSLPKRNSIIVQPNPFENNTILRIRSNEEAAMQVKIFNLNGQIIYQKESTFNKGESQINVDLTNQPDGLYFYQIGEQRGRLIKSSK